MHTRHRMPRKKIPNNICRAHTKGVRAKAPAPFAICCISICELLYVMMLAYVLKEQLIMAEESKARGPMDPRDFWRQWYEATTGALTKVAELEGDPLGRASCRERVEIWVVAVELKIKEVDARCARQLDIELFAQHSTPR